MNVTDKEVFTAAVQLLTQVWFREFEDPEEEVEDNKKHVKWAVGVARLVEKEVLKTSTVNGEGGEK